MRITILRVLKKDGMTKEEIRQEIDRAQCKSICTRTEGMLELFCELMNHFKTESYNATRIYALASILSAEGLNLEISYKEE